MEIHAGIRARLDSMRQMEDGWLEGEGIAPSSEGLDWLADSFRRYFPEDAPRPFLYPTEDGGIQVEWSLGAWRVSWEVDLESRMGEWTEIHVKTDQIEERRLRADEPEVWAWVSRRLREMSEDSG